MKNIITKEQAEKIHKEYPYLRSIILDEFSDQELGIDTFPTSYHHLKEIIKSKEKNKNFKIAVAQIQLNEIAAYVNGSENWINWEDKNQSKFYVQYNNVTKRLEVESTKIIQQNSIYFKKEKDALKSMKHHKELWLSLFNKI